MFGGSSRKDSLKPMEPPAPSFPKQQMLVLAICRICEPIAFMGIFPYVYFMVRDFHITDDPNRIAFYAGLVTSAFTFAEFSTGFLWGRLSDRIGRKPVILTGLTGTALSVLMFGFSKSLTMALTARALGGLLNGNMGVLQSTLTELVSYKDHRPRAFTILPLVWSVGSVIGPMIGGALANPCETFPSVFARGTIWDLYPYLLPNLFSAFICVIGVVNGILFLDETHPALKRKRDRGRELGQWLASKAPWSSQHDRQHSFDSASEYAPLLGNEEQLPGYRTTESSPESSPRLSTARPTSEPHEQLSLGQASAQTDEVPTIFTRNVILNIVSFGILAFHTMTFDTLLPSFLATKAPSGATSMNLPFQFVGGFGFSSQQTGVVMSFQGIYTMVINAVLVPVIIARLTPLGTFRLLAVSYFALYLITPYLVLLPERFSMVGLSLIIVWKATFSSLAYPSNALLTAEWAPSQNVMGTINGAAASTASLCRAAAPAFSGMLYAFGLESGYSGLAWWFSALVTLGGAYVAMRLPEPRVLSEKSRGDIEAAPASS